MRNETGVNFWAFDSKVATSFVTLALDHFNLVEVDHNVCALSIDRIINTSYFKLVKKKMVT